RREQPGVGEPRGERGQRGVGSGDGGEEVDRRRRRRRGIGGGVLRRGRRGGRRGAALARGHGEVRRL
ncbi:hypothetical protein ACHAWF_010282, partial [Thalassiosira exigua]